MFLEQIFKKLFLFKKNYIVFFKLGNYFLFLKKTILKNNLELNIDCGNMSYVQNIFRVSF